MISIIVYGRNDNHGYNLHKRVATSLNCFSDAIKSFAGAEIIFVDWCSDRRSSPLLLSIYDLLSESTKTMTNIVRVSPDQAAKYLPMSSYLHLIEPVARNLGSLHAKNNWILNTTTDIVLSPKSQSKPFSFHDLSSGYYALPRFELPEALWEYLPRTSVTETLKAVNDFADRYNLRLPVLSSHANLYDAPGDFQLVDRKTFFEVGGYDETMTKGWHVDSNFALRCSLYSCKQPNPCLTSFFEAYHMNHNRKPTQQASNFSISNSITTYISNVRHYDWRVDRKASKVVSNALYNETTPMSLHSLHTNTYTSLLKPNRCQNQQNAPLDPVLQDQRCFFDNTLFAGLTEAVNPLPNGSYIHVCSLHSRQLITDLSDISAPNTHFISTEPISCPANYPASLLIIDLRPSTIVTETSEFLNVLRPVFSNACSYLSNLRNGDTIQITLINCDSNFFDIALSHHISVLKNMYFLRCKTGVYIHNDKFTPLSRIHFALTLFSLDLIAALKFRTRSSHRSLLPQPVAVLFKMILFHSPFVSPLRNFFYRFVMSSTFAAKVRCYGLAPSHANVVSFP